MAPSGRPAGYAEFSSPARYVACYPDSWAVLEQARLDDQHDGDMFVGPPGATVNMVVSIVSEPAVHGSVEYAEAAITNLRSRGIGVSRAAPLVVEGVPAAVVTYPRLTGIGQRYTVRQVIWADRGRGWVFTLAHDPPLEPNAADITRVMLGCFRATG